jgi:hypothetical protein
MSVHFIDSASLYQLIELFSKSSVDAELYPWLEQSAVHATQLLLIQPHISMSPSSSVTGGASGLYEKLTIALSGMVGLARPNGATRESNSQDVLQWALRASGAIAQAHAALEADRLNFRKWEQWAIENAWMEHSTRNSGLFDFVFIPAISKILNTSEEELLELQKESAIPEIIDRYIDGGRETRSFRLTRNAYAVAALLRGRFHEVVAQDTASSILQHPLRHGVLAKSTTADPIEYSNTLYFLASIAITSAFAESDPAARIAQYCQNVEILRKCLAMIDVNDPLSKLPGSFSLDLARANAAKFAKDAQIKISSNRLDKFIDAGLTFGGQAIGLLLTPWQSFTASALGFSIPEELKSGSGISNKIIRTEKRLTLMTHFGTAGRLWSKRN